jgi:hypothetical protein
MPLKRIYLDLLAGGGEEDDHALRPAAAGLSVRQTVTQGGGDLICPPFLDSLCVFVYVYFKNE